MKKLVLSICVGVFAAMSLVAFAENTACDLSNGIIRLHVRANSNKDEDQQLKLKVRDRLLEEGRHITESVSDIKSVRRLIEENMALLKEAAIDEIRQNGFDYPVNIRLGKSEFPVKTYGDITLPAGTYEALTVDIGTGEGENWWCVMFPPLCFTSETAECSADTAEDMLIQNLGKDTYSIVKDDKVKIKFKIYEFLERIR